MEEIVENPNMVYLLEDFETLVIKKMVDYIKLCENPVEDLKGEHDFFKKNIKDSLVKQLVDTIRARQLEMTNEETYHWLYISNKQFQQSPNFRFEPLQEKFLQRYFSPYKVPDDGPELQDSLRYFIEALNRYIKHYSTFVDVAHHSLEQFKKKYYGIKTESEENSQSKVKLKTKLTVPELAYLFRALDEEGLLEYRYKTHLFNFIAENFSSKQEAEISAKSIKNKFDTPDFKAVDFWQEKFTHFMQKAKKDKEK